MIEVKNKPWAMLASIYMSQYIGLSFILTASVVILRSSGLPLDKIALVNIVALPIVAKIFFAFIVDHIRSFFQGKYRGWLLLAQSFMFLLLLGISFVDVTQNFSLVILLFFVYSIITCIQDVAVDGLACKIFAENERQTVNATQYAANLFGNIVGGGGVLIFYGFLQWKGSLLVLACLTCISIFQLIIYKEPNEATEQVRNRKEEIKLLWAKIKSFVLVNKVWLLVLMILPIGFSAAYAVINPLLVDAGWSMDDIGFVTKIFGSMIGMLSAWLIIPFMRLFGRIKTLQYLLLLQTFTLCALLLIARHNPEKLTVYFAIGLYSLIQPAVLASISTISMDKVAANMGAKSTFFSMQMSIGVVMGFLYAAISMSLVTIFGYSNVLLASIGFHVIALGIFTACMKKI